MPRITPLADTESLLVPVDVKQYGISGYDVDNAYPQRMQRLINACSTARQAVNMLAKFTVGGGFENLDFYKQKINSKGLTPDKLLRRIALDKAAFRGCAVHVNYNALFQIVSVNYVPFEHCRTGIEDNEGKVCVYNAWEKRAFIRGSSIRKEDIKVIDTFNPDPFVIAAQVRQSGGWDQYKGQIYWHSDDFDEYPIASIGSVLEAIKADIASDKTTTNNLKNNFAAKTIYVEKGKFESEAARYEFKENLQKFIGPDGAPVILVEAENENEIPALIPIAQNLNDKLFEYTDKKTRQKIYRAFNQHGSLHSDTESTFSSQDLRDSMAFYNGYVQDERYAIEEIFTEIFSRFYRPINANNNYTIKPLQYLDNLTPTTNALPVNQE